MIGYVKYNVQKLHSSSYTSLLYPVHYMMIYLKNEFRLSSINHKMKKYKTENVRISTNTFSIENWKIPKAFTPVFGPKAAAKKWLRKMVTCDVHTRSAEAEGGGYSDFAACAPYIVCPYFPAFFLQKLRLSWCGIGYQLHLHQAGYIKRFFKKCGVHVLSSVS